MAEHALPRELESGVREAFGAVVDAGRGGVRHARERVSNAIGKLLDRLANTIVADPLDVHDARSAQQCIDDFTANLANTAAIVGAPWLVNRVMRLVRRGTAMPSTAAIAAGAATFTAAATSVQHLRVLGSLLVHRLRHEGHRVDPAFVRRMTLGLYLDPAVGADAARPNRLASVRLGTEWAAHAVPFFRGRGTPTRVHRAAEAIEGLDLENAIALFERERAIDLRATTRSD